MAEGFLQIFGAYVEPQPPIAGSMATLYVDMFNSGSSDHVMVSAFIPNGQTIINSCYPAGRCDAELGANQQWTESGTFTVLSSPFDIQINTLHWQAPMWIPDQQRTLHVVPGQPSCSGATISRDKASVGVGQPVVFTLWRSPAAAGIIGKLMRCPSSTCSSYTQVGTCTTGSNGTCNITWTPTSADIGSVYFRSEFPGCYSANTYVNVGSAGNIVVTSISVSPSPVISGNTVTITASLKNDGDQSASEYVYLKSDGAEIDSQYKTIAAHSTGSATWTKTAGSSTGFAVGTHNICTLTSGDEKCTSLTVSPVATQRYKCYNGVCTPDSNGGFTTPNCDDKCSTVSVEVSSGNGKVDVYISYAEGWILQGSVSNGQGIKKFYYLKGDQAKFVFGPSTGYTFNKFCSSDGSWCTTSNPYQFTIAGGYAFQAFFDVATIQKWKCTDPATNTCAQASDGTFDTEAICKASTSCQPSAVQTWYCDTSTKICSLKAGSGGYATKALCDATCTVGGGEDPCDKCTSDQYCLFGTCYKKNYVYIAGAAIGLLLILTKK